MDLKRNWWIREIKGCMIIMEAGILKSKIFLEVYRERTGETIDVWGMGNLSL